MNIITGVSAITTGEGKRVTVAYSELDANGNITSTNNRSSYIALDEEVLAAIETLEADAESHLPR